MRLFISSILFYVLCFSPLPAKEKNWTINLKNSDFSYNSKTRQMSSKGITRKGLVSVSRRGEQILQRYWQEGAYRLTTSFNQKILVDGKDLDDVSRISSFRFNKQGEFAFIKSRKGPHAIVELILNNQSILSWPRLQSVKIMAFTEEQLIVSVYSQKKLQTEFWRYKRFSSALLKPEGELLGVLKNCSLLSSKVIAQGILLQTYCRPALGSDVRLLSFKEKKIKIIKESDDDEYFAYGLSKQKKKIALLSVSGSASGKQFFHGISGVLLKQLGEPMSLASDEAGKQSWSQSYRTLTLAELYKKTEHPVFAVLAVNAMENTLLQRNRLLNIDEPFNPDCAWASRIYSKDGKTAISFMINQAMIMNSLIQSCEKTGKYCVSKLRKKIFKNARCLIDGYEDLFVPEQGIYRIPYASNFRFDGIWAPWNWQVSWAALLKSTGNYYHQENLLKRADKITHEFVSSWFYSNHLASRAYWYYWHPLYYKGWSAKQKISSSIVSSKAKNLFSQRVEDINHAGISLLALSFMNFKLSDKQSNALRNTSRYLLELNAILARAMNGTGPEHPRWDLGAGWLISGDPLFSEYYSRNKPGAVSSDQHFAYALLSDKNKPFSLQLTLSLCDAKGCQVQTKWSYFNIRSFLYNNPLFEIRQITN